VKERVNRIRNTAVGERKDCIGFPSGKEKPETFQELLPNFRTTAAVFAKTDPGKVRGRGRSETKEEEDHKGERGIWAFRSSICCERRGPEKK